MTDRPHDNCCWLRSGLFMAGEYPSAIRAQDSADKLSAIVGCWLVRHGLTGAQALDRIATRWQLMEKRTRFPQSPQTDMQVYYIQRWAGLDSGACTEFCVNGLLAGNCRIVWRHDEYEEACSP